SGLYLEKGRDFTYFDIDNNSNVAIVGADFVKGLFNDNDAVDATVIVLGVKVNVIGILETNGYTYINNQDLRVLIHIEVARSIYTELNITYNISVKVDNKEMLDGAQSEAIITFRNIRGLSPVEENNFGIARSDDLINQIFSITGYLNL